MAISEAAERLDAQGNPQAPDEAIAERSTEDQLNLSGIFKSMERAAKRISGLSFS